MLKLVSLLIEKLAERKVEVVVWKNVNELTAALEGKSDVDLYIKRDSRKEFLHCLNDLGFIEAHSPYVFPGVAHYYGFDSNSGKFIHLHCYFRIVTGESHLKQFVLPIEPYLQGVNCQSDGASLNELDAKTQHKIGCFRRQIKLSCLPGLVLFFKERDGYETEQALLKEKSANAIGALPSGWMDEVQDYPSLKAEILGGCKLRWRLRAFNRLGFFQSLILRYSMIVTRFFNKLRNRKKRLAQGVVVAVVGLDGSGKSTAVAMLNDWLAEEFDVETIHYGLGTFSFLTLPLRAMLALRRLLPGKKRNYSEEDGAADAGGAPTGWLPHFRYLGLAWERNRVLAKANRLVGQGRIVVSDRWRSTDIGKMDSPRLDPDKTTGLRQRMARWERKLYECSPNADLLLNIRVDVQTAIQRNRDRVKPGKESDEGIAARFRVNGDLNYRADAVMRVDGTADIGTVHSIIRQHVWDTVVRNNGA